ncbi:hypothetical protein J437_LFUL001597 [Ladona fulva]|uniref:Uncharacterized protein n=1 Tax=Ladona fulva TaxID=123851 RepID=A0A8K0KIZ3_LADFU|nr:hypothetical protein J437_LFUL001597 [Ladona fulva]
MGEISKAFQLDVRIRTRLEEAGIYTFSDVLATSERDLLNRANLCMDQIEKLRSLALSSVRLPQRLPSLIEQGIGGSKYWGLKRSVGCPILDKFLKGGIPARGILELSGESGSGTIYICTEDPFPSRRLIQMIQELQKKCPEAKGITFGDRIYVEHVCDLFITPNNIIIKDTAKSNFKSLESLCATFMFYSIALDDSTDATNTAQLAIFICGIDNEYNITEELALLVLLKDMNRSVDFYEAAKATLARFSLTIDSMSGIVTEGSPAMVEKKEKLCAITLKMENILNVVIKTINFIRSKGLNHRRFQEFLNTLETRYEDILYSTVERWLSCRMLKHFYDLRNEIKCFMDSKGKPVPEFENGTWLAYLACLCGYHFSFK